MTETNPPSTFNKEDYSQWLEIAGMTDFITQYGNAASLTDIKLTDLYRYLQNPYANIKEIQKASKYLTNKHGIVKDVLRTIKSLPTLNYHLHWSSYDDIKKIKKYEQKVDQFLDDIDVRQLVRDGLYEVGEMGTIILCNRSNKYIQFLDLSDLRIIKQRNGKWVAEYDLKVIDSARNVTDKLAIIESLPDEVTVAKYNLYKNKGEDYRYVELKGCDLVNIDGNRNFPYGLPIHIGAWASLLQKEIINRVERSAADKYLKSILILSASHLDKEQNKPVPREIISSYFNEISKLMQKKDGMSQRNTTDSSGVATIALPHFLELKNLKIDSEMFSKEVYEKIDNEIFANLGVSSALVYGGGTGNYSSAQMNSEKLFRYIFTIIERFERIINGYIKLMLPNGIACKIVFDRSTISSKEKMIDKYKEFFMQTNIIQPYAEALLGVDYKFALAQAEYENKVLKKEKIIYPAQNAFTQSGNSSGAGRPSIDDTGGTGGASDNTNKGKTNGNNNNPSPSD